MGRRHSDRLPVDTSCGNVSPVTSQLNIGCGQTPTPGWLNYDNSWSVRLAGRPALVRVLAGLRLISKDQKDFIAFAQREKINWADATSRIPLPDHSVDTIYTSHMVEHLEPARAEAFLAESRRVLRSGGVLRIAVPDISVHVNEYLEHGDADRFIGATHLTHASPKSLIGRIQHVVIGERNHRWMYDGQSLCRLLTQAGFDEVDVVPPGRTNIADAGDLDLSERVPESVFVEAVNVV